MNASHAEIFERLAESILTRYHRSQEKSLLDVYRVNPDFLKVDPDYLEFILTERDGILSVLADPDRRAQLVDLFVKEAQRYTFEKNQFIQMDEGERRIFIEIYTQYLGAIRTAIETSPDMDSLEDSLSRAMAAHFRRLSGNLARFFDPQAARSVQQNLVFQRAVCSEYSAELQLKLLGVKSADLKEPLLDIGCGQEGKLVRYLKTLGLDAHGSDRLVDDPDLLIRADWFDLELRPNTWGTIISHMAFSNHFNFHHRYKNGQPERYARLYLKILQSLQPGGSFFYTPGLPFIEPFLPRAVYQVRRVRLKAEQVSGMHAAGAFQDDFWYAARVTRIGPA